jgi:hypothetical protein
LAQQEKQGVNACGIIAFTRIVDAQCAGMTHGN